MRRLLFFGIPVLCGIIAFFIVTFILSQKNGGKGALQVTSNPKSNVYVNNVFVGQTPLCKCDGQNLLSTGTYTIRLVPTDSPFSNQPYEQKITINPSVLTVVDRTFGQGATADGSVITLFPQANTAFASLQVTSFPSDVSVSIDGNSIGSSPLTASRIVASDHDLLLKKSGYKDKIIRIHTVNGYTLSITAFLAIDPRALSATTSAQSAAALPPSPSVAKVTILDTSTGFLRVRKGPSLGDAQITEVKPGEQYDYITEQNGWTEIKLSNGTEGWVSSQFVQKQ